MGTYEQWRSARKVCVIGAGTMGSGIAAHLANLGFEVTLLDLTPESVEAAFGRAKSAKPPHFFVPETAERIRLGSIRDNLEWVKEVDWVCEAIIEKMDAKKALFEQLDALLPETTAITTNTSGLQIELLCEGRSESFRRRFMGTHFFNPPRYLKLLELIPTGDTDADAVRAMAAFLEARVARRVVVAKDTPGFIANRFGMWSMFQATHTAEKLHLTVEQADAITGPFLGRPRTGSFRLNDLVGLDIMLDIARNLQERCPDDPYRAVLEAPKSLQHLLEKGWIGDKAGQGYYRREGKELVALDLQTLAYRERQEAQLPTIEALAKAPLVERLRGGLEAKDEVGEFLRNHLLPILEYANYLKEEISHSVQDFDRVMQWGFGWEAGPFAMIDMVGPERFGLDAPFYKDGTQRDFSGTYVSLPSEPQFRTLRDYPVLEKRDTFTVRDLGDEVKAIGLTTKMGTVNPQLLSDLNDFLESNDGPMVLAGESKHFSLGFDLSFFKDAIERLAWTEIDAALELLQKTAVLLSTRPIVAAVHGYCLGGGFELAFQCPVMAIHCDAMVGFPEAKVGLIPGGGGTSELGLRSSARGAKAMAEMAVRLTCGETGVNADQARNLGYVRLTDVTVYSLDRLITDAKALAGMLKVPPRAPWHAPEGPLAGMIDQKCDELKEKGVLTDYDCQIGDKVKQLFAKSASFEDALQRERRLFVELCQKSFTHTRICHMLETGKPLRN